MRNISLILYIIFFFTWEIAACSSNEITYQVEIESQQPIQSNLPTASSTSTKSSTPTSMMTFTQKPVPTDTSTSPPTYTPTPIMAVTKTYTDVVLYSGKIQLLGEDELRQFRLKETEFPEAMHIEQVVSNQDLTVKAYNISACSYCDYEAEEHDSLVCEYLAQSYRDSSEDDGLNLCMERLFFKDTIADETYELEWLPRLGWRPISNLIWVGNDNLVFHVWTQPHFGTGYVFDFNRREFTLVGIIADETWTQ